MIYAFEEYELDTQLYELRHRGEARALERQVFDVLAYLVEHRDRVVTKEELFDHVWGDRFISEAALSSRLMAARRAIGDSGKEQRLIRTVHGRGFRFVGPVSVKGSDSQKAPVEPAGRLPALEETRLARQEQHIRFCTAPDGVRIAYATVGDGPPLVKAANWLSHLEFDWRSPVWRHWLEELSRDHMLVRYDERGCGLSDWNVEDFSWEAWVRDLETVVDALGLERFPLLGISQGGSVAIAYTVRHPERVSHLILYGTYARARSLRGPTAEQVEERKALLTLTRHGWGRDDPAYRQIFTLGFIPGATSEQMHWFNDLQRQSTSGENAVRFMTTFDQIDVVDLLPRVKTPTLVLHARDEARVPFEEGRLLAAGIQGARFVPLEGRNHILLEQEPAWEIFLREVRTFLGVERVDRRDAGAQPALATILFTDLESSTRLTQTLGDARAQELIRRHNEIVRRALEAHDGTEIKHTGDGIMASFPSPSRALECAVTIQRGMEAQTEVPIRLRIGLNAGEPIVEEADLFGAAVQLARRICDHAQPGQVLLSDVVRQLAAGKGFRFGSAGEALLKGFDEPVRLFEVLWRE